MRKLKHYQTINEFQEDYPDRESREAFVGTLSNEEIDELIDLCSAVQGKVYYRKQKKQEIVFEYTLYDAWFSVLHAFRILDGPAGGYAEYIADPQDSPYLPMRFSAEGEEIVRISSDDLKQIRLLLDNDRLFETEELEHSVQHMVLDGYQQEFEISSRNRHIKVSGCNIQACRGDSEHCPHSVLMIKVLEQIKKVLVPLGIPRECFGLVSWKE